jgi:hypothetical protein
MKALRVTKGVNAVLLVAGVWATIEPMQSAEKSRRMASRGAAKLIF